MRPAVGIVAGAISAFYPFFIYYSGQVLTETLFMALVVWLFVAGFWAVERRTAPLLRSSSAPSPASRRSAGRRSSSSAPSSPCGAPGARRSCPWRRLRLAGVAGVAMLAVMLPWGLRNEATHGQLILTTTKLGYNLYKYYHPTMTADQTVRTVPFPDFGERTEPQREALLRAEGQALHAPRTRRARCGSWPTSWCCCSS